MKLSAFKTVVATVLLVLVFASSSHAVMYAVKDYTVDTPLGRVGYAELRSTLWLGAQGAGGTGYFFFGPFGKIEVYRLVQLYVIMTLVLAFAYLLYVRSRKRRNNDAA